MNGLRSAIKQGFMEWLKREKPDVLCLQEIKAKGGQLPLKELEILGYHCCICEADKPGYAGTLIISKSKPKTQNCILGLQRFDTEGRMVELCFSDFSLINFYLPHGGRQKENLEYKLDCYDHIIKHCGKRKNLILAGDFNIAHTDADLARPKPNRDNIMFTPDEREKFNELLNSGFVDSFRNQHPGEGGHYTWWPYMADARKKNLGWRIDYILVSENLKTNITKTAIMKTVAGSDHCPILLEFNQGA